MACFGRLHLIDTIRGAALVSMVLFHLMYDLVYIYGHQVAWFCEPLVTLWQSSVGWTFVIVAGASAFLSHSNYRRALRLAVVALAITAVTYAAHIDIPVWFGVIHCLAACTLLTQLARRFLDAFDPRVMSVSFLVLALVTHPVQDGSIWLIGNIALPSWLYRYDFLAWLGFPGPTFTSGDYYPLLPYFFLYVFGYELLRALSSSQIAMRSLKRGRIAWLAFLGRHSLGIYLLHQPLILGLLMAFQFV